MRSKHALGVGVGEEALNAVLGAEATGCSLFQGGTSSYVQETCSGRRTLVLEVRLCLRENPSLGEAVETVCISRAASIPTDCENFTEISECKVLLHPRFCCCANANEARGFRCINRVSTFAPNTRSLF